MTLAERPPCSSCFARDGEHRRDCPELVAMLQLQADQRARRVAGCNHAYPTYRDGRCMGCGALPQ